MSEDSTNIFQNLLDQIYVYNLNETHPDTFNSLRLEKQAKKAEKKVNKFKTKKKNFPFFGKKED